MKKYYDTQTGITEYCPSTSSIIASYYLCSEADAVIASLRAHIADPSIDIQEAVIKKLDLVSRDALAARDKTIEELKELVEQAFGEGMMNGIADQRGSRSVGWIDSVCKIRLNYILGPHSDLPA